MSPREAGIIKRSVSIAGHRTSVSLEQPFWDALQDIARERGRPVQKLIGEIDTARGNRNLSSAIRIYVLMAAQAKAVNPNAAVAQFLKENDRSAAAGS
jgi:predicted DNA-binding ribbon-helix-helix protein